MSKRLVLAFLTCIAHGGVYSEEPGTASHFVRSCMVYSEPSLHATRACLKRAGEKINYSDSAPGGFVQVEMEDCAGYVPDTCVAGPIVTEKTGVHRELPHRRSLFRMGVGATFDGTIGSTSSGGDASGGQGWSVGARFDIALNNHFYLSLIPQWQKLGLSRNLASTGGALLDPSNSKFSQTVSYYGGSVLLGLVVHRKFFDGNPITDPELAIEGGFQYLIPSSASQTNDEGKTNVTFKTTDKPLLFVVGPAIDLAFFRHVSAFVTGQFFINVGGSGGSRFYGGRLGIAFMAGLL